MKTKILWIVLAGLALLGGIGYGVYWINKTVNYNIYYKGMVQDTVREMVKPECLKPEHVKDRPPDK